MNKIILEKEIGDCLEIDTDRTCGDKPCDIDIMIDFLTKVKQEGATHLNIWGSIWEGTLEEVTLQGITIVEETDEELNSRLEKEKQRVVKLEEDRKRSEMQLFENLKLKYGK